MNTKQKQEENSEPMFQSQDVAIQQANATEAEMINDLIVSVFMACVAPDYSQEGIDFFLSICRTNEIREMITSNNTILIAKQENEIIGVLWT